MASKRLSVKQAKLLKQHRYIMHKLVTSSDKDRRTILRNAPLDLFKALNLVFKLLDGEQLNLTSQQSNRIKKHKRLIRSASGLNNSHIKGELVRQKGGALSAILSTVLPIIGGLVKAII